MHAFIINLDSATDRWAFIQASFAGSQLVLCRVPAVDAKTLTLSHAQYSERLYRWFHGRTPNVRELACYLSHLKAMIAGFIIASRTGGSGQVLVRALGPSLGDFGVADPLADPLLDLYDANGLLIASSDSWQSDQETEITATGLQPSNNAEAAILITLAPGAYTAIESGKNGGTGVGLVEVYNLH